jgi:hypothetical protein
MNGATPSACTHLTEISCLLWTGCATDAHRSITEAVDIFKVLP